MTAFTCPRHGRDFDREGLPDVVKSCMCPECAHDIDAARAQAQIAYDACFKAWHAWMDSSGVPARGRNRTLDNWQPQGRPQQAAWKLLRSYAADIGQQVDSGCGLTLLGPPGVGKTHIGYGLVAAAYLSDIHARYAVWSDVVDRTKASFASRDSGDRHLIDELERTPLLVLDEIGVRAGTEFDQALLFGLIDARYRNQRATIVASNLTADTLDRIGERTADRLREVNRTVPVPGESQRTAAAMNRNLIDAPPALIEPQPPVIAMSVCINGEMEGRPLVVRKPEV